VEASAKDGAHNGSGGAKTVRVRYEVMRCERGYRGRPMAEGNKWRGQGMRYNGHIFSGRLTWKGAGHLVGGECVGNTKTTERGGGGESVVYELKQFYTF
jgi:hypothetical protein